MATTDRQERGPEATERPPPPQSKVAGLPHTLHALAKKTPHETVAKGRGPVAGLEHRSGREGTPHERTPSDADGPHYRGSRRRESHRPHCDDSGRCTGPKGHHDDGGGRQCLPSVIVIVDPPCEAAPDGGGVPTCGTRTTRRACLGPGSCSPEPLLATIDYALEKTCTPSVQDACDIDTAGCAYIRCRKASGEGSAPDVIAAEALLQYWRVTGFNWDNVTYVLVTNLRDLLLPLVPC